jgi:hypothetical protein
LILRQLDERGTITLPREMREGVTLVAIERRDDGVIELRPQVAVDQTQAWFWTARWQAMEREADTDIRQGAMHRATSAEFLDELANAARSESKAGAPVPRAVEA